MALKFIGPLSKYMEPRRIGLLDDDDIAIDKRVTWAVEDHKSLHLLCEHYGISEGPDQYYFLAIRLAREIVPCFQEKMKEGRPRKWDDHSLGVLAVEVERVTSTGATLDSAVKTLAKRAPWKLILEQWGEARSSFGADPAAALLKAYQSARTTKWSRITREAFRSHELMETVDEWDAEVRALKGNN